jgi:hypothetical protein
VSLPNLSRIPGVPGVPDGGVAGGAGVTVRVVSRGSWARARGVTTLKATSAAPASATIRRARAGKCAELVVCVSLTNERTVYFTP